MTFRASNVTADKAYNTVRSTAVNLKSRSTSANAKMLAGPVSYGFVSEVHEGLSLANEQFNELKTTPGLADYAQSVENDPGYDVVAEFATMQNAITSAIAWLEANLPTNVTANTLPVALSTGEAIADTFSTAQTAQLRTLLSTVESSIS